MGWKHQLDSDSCLPFSMSWRTSWVITPLSMLVLMHRVFVHFFSDSEVDVFIGAYFHRYYDIHNVNGLDVHHPTPKFKRNSVGDTGFEVQRTTWAQGDYLVPGSLIVHSK